MRSSKTKYKLSHLQGLLSPIAYGLFSYNDLYMLLCQVIFPFIHDEKPLKILLTPVIDWLLGSERGSCGD